jgi:hypothetical protein
MPKKAIDTWKDYVLAVKYKQLLDVIGAQKLKNTLNRVSQRCCNKADGRRQNPWNFTANEEQS